MHEVTDRLLSYITLIRNVDYVVTSVGNDMGSVCLQ